MEIVTRLSPNRGARRLGARADMVVIHFTAMKTAEAALDRLTDAAAEVSSHYLVAEDGRCWLLVPEEERAWHAGAGAWGPVTDVNSRSVGIELANPGDRPFDAPQMAVLEALLDGIMARWQVPPERVIGHSDMAPGRKDDPGRHFDWPRLAAAGRAVGAQGARGLQGSPRSGTPEPARFERAARRFGYVPPQGRVAPVLEAFRQRFRPRAEGPLTQEDIAVIEHLAARWPCART
ncbi:N-acetylmuramoyl-L-alanine amidase [Paroceanicella profunda]|nr:N-acetylmuramoyl-L-alanine amidase [Paroceanicella profunda]